jgi:NAD(P)-dependent dehydrogenase (short-subunit alcohol dehydrogenase family)
VNYFVTGGSRGIGAGIVLRAIRDGHDVAFTYVKGESQAEEVIAQARAINASRRCKAYQVDVRDSARVDAVAEEALHEFDGMQVVVANAGIHRNNLAVNIDDAEWREVIDTNLSGAFYVCRAFLTSMLGGKYGRLILVSSLAAGGMKGQAHYAASKAGLEGLSCALAKEYGRKGITSNVIVPGTVETDMVREGLSDQNRQFWSTFCPVGRMGTVDDLAALVGFLASKDASYINGQVLNVTGGLDWII